MSDRAPQSELKVTLRGDARPLLDTLAAVNAELELDGEIPAELREVARRFRDFPAEMAHIDPECRPARAGELVVRIQPSDRLLVFLAALRARDIDRRGVEDSGHGSTPKGMEP